MLDFLDLLGAADDFFLLVVVLRVEPVGLKTVLTGAGADDLLIVDVQGNAIARGHFLGKNDAVFSLYLP